MGRLLVTALLIGGLCSPGAADWSDLPTPFRMPIRSFTDRDGLPQSSIEDLALDSEGRVWVVTRNGAALWDGERWTTVDMPPTSTSNWPRTLALDPEGGVWFGTHGGDLHRLLDGEWRSYGAKDGLVTDEIRSLEVVRRRGDFELWIGTSDGVARWRRGTIRTYSGPEAPSGVVTSLTGRGDRLWAGTRSSGLWLRDGSRWITVPLPWSGTVTTLSLLGRDPGFLWAGGRERLARLDLREEIWSTWNLDDGIPRGNVSDISPIVRPDGRSEIWIATEGGGLGRLFEGRWTILDEQFGLSSPFLFSLLPIQGPDLASSLYVGTLSGLDRIRLGAWIGYDETTGLPTGSVVSLLETGTLEGPTRWFGTSGGGLLRMGPDGSRRVFGTGDGLPDASVFSLLAPADPSDEIGLLAGTDSGLAEWTGREWRALNLPPDLGNHGVVALLRDREGNLWVGTYGGGVAVRSNSGEWTRFDTSSGVLPDDRIEALLEVPGAGSGSRSETRILVATNRGLAIREEESWNVLGVGDGLPSDEIRSLHLSQSGPGPSLLWVGTGRGLAFRPLDDDDGAWTVLEERSRPALPDEMIYRIEEDTRGRIYLTTNRGVVRLTPRGSSSDWPIAHYTTLDGLPGNECNFGASLTDGEGRIWVGTQNGVGILDPAREVRPDRAPRIRWGQIRVDDQPTPGGPGGLEVDHRGDRLSFGYRLPVHARLEKVRYRTQLQGWEEAPSEWTASRETVFTNLPPGPYVFRVEARDGFGNPAPVEELPITVVPPPWRTWWAYLLYAASGLLALGGIVRWRERSLRTRARRLEGEVREQTARLEEKVRLLEASEQRAREARQRLARAQSKVTELMDSSPGGLENIPACLRSVADHLGAALGCDRVDLWIREGDDLRPITGGEIPAPSLPSLSEAAASQIWIESHQRTLVPLEGLSGEILGALGLQRSRGRWDGSEQRLISSLARHVGSVVELIQTQQSLLELETRRRATRRQLMADGAELLALCPECGACYDHDRELCERDGRRLRTPRRNLPYRIQNRYRFVRRIGEGAVGTVFEGRDEEAERPVAVKILNSDHFESVQSRLRFQRETRAVARIRHPGVVTLYDSGQLPDGSGFLVMELLEGIDLGRLLSIHGRGRPDQVAELVRQGGAGLEAAHLQSLVHRDIKPQNLFLSPV
ncbi:MAG: two-component regulator propeller domain-containing protein, partial [Thermoanaerobaculia bacterium]|nr:two-component regulator propeller domain-containing protein [Thermoanaerobaculia bacterium]